MTNTNNKGIIDHTTLIVFVIFIVAILGVASLVFSEAKTKRADPQPNVVQPIVDNSANEFDVPSDDSDLDNNQASAAMMVDPPKPNHNKDTKKSGSKTDRTVEKKARSIARTAKRQLGSGPRAGWPSGQWCAAFASSIYSSNGVNMPYITSTSRIKSWGQSKRLWHRAHTKYNPRTGDLVVYGSAHVGVVVASDGKGQIKTIDGNWGNRVSYHTSGVNYSGPIWANYRNFYTSGQPVTGFVSPGKY